MEKQNDALWEFDRAFGVPLCGVDEAGRGPLAGPVFAACAVLKPGAEIPWLNDSKKLTEKRREAIFRDILENGKAWFGIGTASPAEIDRLNILRATCLAMNRAYAAMLEQGLPGELLPALALVDGNRDPGLPLASTEAAAMAADRLSPLTTVWVGMGRPGSRLPSTRASRGSCSSGTPSPASIIR